MTPNRPVFSRGASTVETSCAVICVTRTDILMVVGQLATQLRGRLTLGDEIADGRDDLGCSVFLDVVAGTVEDYGAVITE